MWYYFTHEGLSQQRQSHRGHPISYPDLEEANEADCYLVGICQWAAMRLLGSVYEHSAAKASCCSTGSPGTFRNELSTQ